MEGAVLQLEESTKSADERISKISTKLEMFEQNYIQGISQTDSTEEDLHVSVLGLLRDVNQVKTECDDLKQELGRVHELKCQLNKDLESQVYVVNDLFVQLRNKIINHANNIHGGGRK
uniref:Ska2 N-terminal domain-containing protein n=1 Tax=Cacopsylla melanoneura TaxID=428564 RepID=A0A8D8V898_9HEMI